MSIEEIIKGLEDTAQLFDRIRSHQPETGKSGTASICRAALALLRTHPDAQPNEPLTLEELRKMDGEPVWLDVAGGMWALVEAQTLTLWLDRGGRYDATAFVGKIYRRPSKEEN